jgi:hydroxypyruvate reductase
VVVASPEELAKVAAAELRSRGVRVRLLPPSQAPASALAKRYRALAARLGRRSAVLRVAEPSLEIPPNAKGRGGRSTHLATLVARALPPGVAFLAAATDGVDGRSGTAGAIVDRAFARRAGANAITKALAEFDTGSLHVRARTAIPMGPTGHNLADLHVLIRS